MSGTYYKNLWLLQPKVEKDPRNLPLWRKRLLLGLVCFIAIIPGFCSTIYLPALEEIITELDSPTIMVTLSNSLYMLFMGIAPIFYSSITDHWNIRRSVYFFSIVIYTGGSLGGCFARDIYVLLGMRILQAIGISSAWAIGSGSVADVYDVHERGNALGIYFTGQFAGPLFGPIFGGFLVERWGWPSVFWLLFAIGCCLLLLVFFTMEETYRDESVWGPGDGHDPGVEDIDEKSEGPPAVTEEKILNPLSSLMLLRHPFVFISATATGFAFGGMFAIENMLPDLYTKHYQFSSSLIGLSFISPGLGEVIGSLLSGKFSDIYLNRQRAKRGGKAVPEDRLAPNVWPAAFILNPLSFFLWGWPVEKDWNVWVSIIMFGVQCFAMVQVFNPVMSYLVDAVPGKGASVTAAANFWRMVWTFALSLLANPMTNAVGPGWVTFFFGMLNLVWAFLVLLLRVKPQIRHFSGY